MYRLDLSAPTPRSERWRSAAAASFAAADSRAQPRVQNFVLFHV
jgi:hypothetical protein